MINYILQGFGFTGWRDFINSSFGHILSVNFIAVDVVISALFGLIHFLFGFNHLFLAAYVVLLVGIGKELYDKYVKNTFIDWWDIVASLTPYFIVKYINK